MKFINIKRTLGISALGLVTLLGTSSVASAQYTRHDRKQDKKIVKQQQKIAKQQDKIQKMQAKNRYRVYRNGSYYQTDNRGAELLQQAVNRGYQQGFNAGKNDRSGRRGSNYSNSQMYRSGNYGYQSYVDSSQYQHYFREGFQRGYQDGYNSRYQYGTNSNGGVNILGSILQQILNFQQY